MKRIEIRLTESQRERLRREAGRRHVSIAALVREAVDRTYADQSVERRAAREHSRSLIGKFHGGPTDVSGRHDGCLADAGRTR